MTYRNPMPALAAPCHGAISLTTAGCWCEDTERVCTAQFGVSQLRRWVLPCVRPAPSSARSRTLVLAVIAPPSTSFRRTYRPAAWARKGSVGLQRVRDCGGPNGRESAWGSYTVHIHMWHRLGRATGGVQDSGLRGFTKSRQRLARPAHTYQPRASLSGLMFHR